MVMSRQEDTDRQRAAEFDRLGIKHAPCATCGTPAQGLSPSLCDGCWEVEHRLADYLRDGGDKAMQVLVRALTKAGYEEIFES